MFVGTDIVEVDRIKNAILSNKLEFIERVFTVQERMTINIDNPDYERAAGFWAAKESIVKAIGTGFRHGILFHDAEVTHDELGCPYFIITGRLKKIITEKKITKISLSISHCRTHAIAVAVIS